QEDLAAHPDGEEVRDARRRFLEVKEELLVLDHALDDPREARRAVDRLHALAIGQPPESERAEELVPYPGLALRAHGHEGDDLARLSTEGSEVDLEAPEERGPALFDPLQMLVPTFGAREP